MGPATAVLAIPALQWITTDAVGDQYFEVFIFSEPQTMGWVFNDSECSTADFLSLAYSCTTDKWGAALDAWFESSVATAVQAPDGDWRLESTTRQSNVRAAINVTEDIVAGVTTSERSGCQVASFWTSSARTRASSPTYHSVQTRIARLVRSGVQLLRRVQRKLGT